MKRLAVLGLVLPGLAVVAAPATQREACVRLGAEIERVGQARSEALDKGDNAWKTVLPFAVIARKVSSKAALDEADKQLAALRRQAQAEGCDAR